MQLHALLEGSRNRVWPEVTLRQRQTRSGWRRCALHHTAAPCLGTNIVAAIANGPPRAPRRVQVARHAVSHRQDRFALAFVIMPDVDDARVCTRSELLTRNYVGAMWARCSSRRPLRLGRQASGKTARGVRNSPSGRKRRRVDHPGVCDHRYARELRPRVCHIPCSAQDQDVQPVPGGAHERGVTRGHRGGEEAAGSREQPRRAEPEQDARAERGRQPGAACARRRARVARRRRLPHGGVVRLLTLCA
jgi:hypothetical protein